MIDLLFVTNDNYCPHLATTLMSVAASTPGPLRANIVTNDASNDSREKIALAVPTMELRWFPCDSLDGLPTSPNGIDPISYGRLFGPRLLDGEVERVLYLDSDTLVRRDLTALWTSDLGPHPLAAVRDAWVTWFGHPTLGLHEYDSLGFEAKTPYFNAGVMVIDVQRWKEFDAERRCLEFLKTQTMNRFADQDALNAVFANHWKPLPMEWNVFADPNVPTLIALETSTQDVASAQSDPGIVHYAGYWKPWAPFPNSELLFLAEWQSFANTGPFAQRYQKARGTRLRRLRERVARAARLIING